MDTGEGSVKTDVSLTEATPKVEAKKVESVSMTDYVGVKEMLRKREQELINVQSIHENEKVNLQSQIETLTSQMQELTEAKKNLEEQSKTMINQTELVKVQEALNKKTGEVLETKKDLICTKYGVEKESLKDLSDTDLRAFEKGLSLAKGKSPTSKPDIGGSGGGLGGLTGSPMELATEAYSKTKK
jgi:chromosome segregation ATPase